MGTVGQSVRRLDAEAKVRGSAKYVDDLVCEGGLHGATVRSPIARGRLLGVRWDPDFDWEGIVRVGPEDIPGVNVITFIVDDQPALAEGELRHVMEPVALLACEDRERLALALKHVHVDYEPLEPVLDFLQSDVVIAELSIRKGDVEAGMAAADLIVEGEYRVGHQEQMYIEPQGMLAEPRADGGMKVTGSLQCPYYVEKALGPLLGLPSEKIEVVQATTGGGFGGKEEYPSMIAGHACLLAQKAGRPVRIIYDRSEDIAATTKRHPAVIRIRHGVKRDGTLTAVDAEVIMDGGAYATLSKVVLSRGIIHAVGPYRCDNVRIDGRAMQTHTPPNGAFRGFGAPQTTWAYERQMDKIAAALGIEPLDLRQRLQLRLGDTTATDQVLGASVGGQECFDAALEASDYVRRRRQLSGAPRPGPLKRGIGLSFFFHGEGFTGGKDAVMPGGVCLDLLPAGRVRIRTGSSEIGQGVRTVFPQIAADALGIPLSLIEFEETSTALVPDSGPTVASRTTMIVGKVIEEAARQMADRVGGGGEWTARADAHLAEHGPLTISHRYHDAGGTDWDEGSYRGDAYPCYGWACDVVEVEVDTDTGEVRLLDVWMAQDIGKAIHPVMCEGQIEGGTLQGIGHLLLEEVVMADGAYRNDRMTNYIIPTSLDTPPMHTQLIEVPYPHGPFGAKGVGELPMDGIGPAIASAIEHATGIFIERQPALPEYLLELWEAKR